MAGGKIIGITVDIEGKTSGLTKSLQQANSSINKTTAALKDVDKALQLDPTNVELVTLKEQLLNKQIEQTNEKLEILSQVAEDANDALERGDISQEQYASLTAEISRTESALGDLESEANGSADSLEEVGDQAEEAGDDAEAFGEAASAAGEAAAAAFEIVGAAVLAVGAALVGLGVEGVSALVNTTAGAAELSDEINTLSMVTGLSTDTIQELNYASSLLDVDTQTVTSSITKLTKTMNSAADGSESTAKKFEDLGISYLNADGSMRDAEDVFWDAIDVLGTMENETERDAAAMELFGKSAKELNPLIIAGSDAFQELADEAHEVGYVMDSETLDAFNGLQDNMDRLDNMTQAVSNSMGQVLLPVLTDMSDDAVDLMGEFSGALAESGGDIDKIGEIIDAFAPQAIALIEKYTPKLIEIIEKVLGTVLKIAISLAPQVITMIGSLIEQLASAIADNAGTLAEAFGNLLSSAVEAIVTLLPVIIPIAVELVMTLVNAILDNAGLIIESALSLIMTLVNSLLAPEQIATILTAAATIVITLLTGLTNTLPQLIPVAINAILTIVETLLSSGCLAEILSAALTLIVTLADALVDAIPEIYERLPEIIMAIVKFLTVDALPDIVSAGFTLLTALIGDLPNIILAVVGALIDLISAMLEYLSTDALTDITNVFASIFDGIVAGASTWGTDLMKNFIDGIASKVGELTSQVNDIAGTVSDYLHFSEPEKGPLSDFNESGADMIKNFIGSMESEQYDLEAALNETASVIGQGWSNSLSISANAALSGSQGGAVGASVADNATWIFPVYIGGDHIDTIVVDAVDRYNYMTGGH